METIPIILDELRAGRMVVLVDDEDRENEGDLIMPAQAVTPEAVNFMLKEARGVLCLCLTGQACERLKLEPQAAVNTTQRGTAFMVSIDATSRFGVTTGVSAADRAATIRVAADPASRPEDLDRPGHINPLRARDGGVLVRAGQTEGSVDLCRLAGLAPAAVIIEIMKDDGSMARRDDLATFCAKHGLKMCSVADIIEHRMQRERMIERIAEAPFDSEFGRFDLIAFRSRVDPLPHVALCCGGVGKLDASGHPVPIHEPVLVRMHSQNLLGDVFGDRRERSGELLKMAMARIQAHGQGALVYLRHEAMGEGLLRRLQTTHRVDSDPAPANPGPGGAPLRHGSHGIGSQILRDLGLRQLRLLTNHPFTPRGLEGFGLSIKEFVSV